MRIFFKRSGKTDPAPTASSEGDQLALVSGFVALGAGWLLLAAATEVQTRPIAPRPEHVLLEGTAWLPPE
jgi:hypothetical protein